MKILNLEQIKEKSIEFFKNEKIDFKITSICPADTICTIEQIGEQTRYRQDLFDGLVIICYIDGTFEVSEFQAGKEKNKLHVYTYTNSLKIALNSFIKGNNRKPIQIY